VQAEREVLKDALCSAWLLDMLLRPEHLEGSKQTKEAGEVATNCSMFRPAKMAWFGCRFAICGSGCGSRFLGTARKSPEK